MNSQKRLPTDRQSDSPFLRVPPYLAFLLFSLLLLLYFIYNLLIYKYLYI